MALQFDLIILVRGFYLLSAAVIVVIRLIPLLKDRFLDYGARGSHLAGAIKSNGPVIYLLNYVATFKMPHSMFWHFYSFSSACTAFWILQASQGSLLHVMRDYVPGPQTERTTSPAKIGLCFLLLWIQALRRLQECISLSKDRSSTSRMWVGHYLIGMAFYFVTNVAIFVEHVHLLLSLNEIMDLFLKVDRGPSLLETAALLFFVIASKIQHDCHVYLANLKEYTLPDIGAFRYVVAPHYTVECAIYLSLAIISAPAGQQINPTMLCALVFVTINLGVTADGTKKWMFSQFSGRHDDIQRRWKMVPGLF